MDLSLAPYVTDLIHLFGRMPLVNGREDMVFSCLPNLELPAFVNLPGQSLTMIYPAFLERPRLRTSAVMFATGALFFRVLQKDGKD